MITHWQIFSNFLDHHFEVGWQFADLTVTVSEEMRTTSSHQAESSPSKASIVHFPAATIILMLQQFEIGGK